MKSLVIIWLLAILVGVGGVLWISREIDRNVSKSDVGALYEGTDELPDRLEVVNNYGLVDTYNPQKVGRNENSN